MSEPTNGEGSQHPGATSLMGLFSPPTNGNSAANDGANSARASAHGDPRELTKNNNDGMKFIDRSAVDNDEVTADSNLKNGDKDSIAKDSDWREDLQRQNTARLSNKQKAKTLMEMFDSPERRIISPERSPSANERMPLLNNRRRGGYVVGETDAFGDLHAPPLHEVKGSIHWSDAFGTPTEPTPKTGSHSRKSEPRQHDRSLSELPMPAIDEFPSSPKEASVCTNVWAEFRQTHLQLTTFVGAFMFLLYHVVFCLAMGSSIIRKHSKTPILGLTTKMAACGVIFCAPVYIYRLGNIPALYPTIDLFLAPFIANLASIVDDALEADDDIKEQDEDQVFVNTLAVLTGIGLSLSGLLLVLAGKFRLANLGSYLPYPVLCGFFSAAGIMMWKLAFTVDCNGKSLSQVFGSGDWSVISNALLHHLPSLLIAITMKLLGPRNPFYVSMLVVITISLFYIVMAITGTSLDQARKMGWFWSEQDLVYHSRVQHCGFDKWAPPAPFGVIIGLFEGKVHWGAVVSSMSTVCALSFLYVLRCFFHGTSLKSNVANLSRTAKEGEIMSSPMIGKGKSIRTHRRLFSEALDIEAVPANASTGSDKPRIRAKPCHVSLEKIMSEYGHSQFVSAIVGSFGVIPCVAASPAMFGLGAEGVAAQYGSVLLIVVFYLTNFELVGYIPKAAFSSLIVLSFLDIMVTWFINAYKKTSDKIELIVVPVIIIAAFVVGLLNAVFLGIATSTLLFVAAFFRSGVVKFVASGLTVRSTIERSFKAGFWLDQNGDQIQILVLQNYLFFGNASSILTYISTMFEEPGEVEDELDYELPQIPKFVILDFTLVTGIDTSTVDVVSSIISLCRSHECNVFLAGLSPRMRLTLSHGGVKPEKGERAKRRLRFFSDLDSALGKAEDMLLVWENEDKPDLSEGNRRRLLSEGDNGFRFALRHIDEQHGKHFAEGLIGLQKHTVVVELAPGECIFESNGGPIAANQRGLFFIEEGIIKIVRDASTTLTRGSMDFENYGIERNDSLTKMNARVGSIGRQAARLKEAARRGRTSHHFRIARVGPGWVVGTMEGASGLRNPGLYVAVSHCRLHHLPFYKIQELEEEDPKLVLRLYKLLAHTMAKRQDITIEQLATLHSIITSTAPTSPISRAAKNIP